MSHILQVLSPKNNSKNDDCERGIRLMASQIKQLRASFDKMLTAHKEQFISNLKQKLQSKAITEHTKILSDCVQKYNMVVRNGSQTITTTPIDRKSVV